MEEVILETDLEGLSPPIRGKVRDIYDLGDELLIVATDRISAFDCVLPNGIPEKGKILTAMSVFWFNFVAGIVGHHLITAEVDGFPEQLKRFKDILAGRSMLVKKARRLNVECVVRGYLAGSGWREYREKGGVCGIGLPAGLRQSDELSLPVFTPATKAASGHDENITWERMVEIVGQAKAEFMRRKSFDIYRKASQYAESRGIIIADTKFEFGLLNDRIILIDEILSPDSSRFWPKEEYRPGEPQKSFDKQFVRDYLESLDWPKTPPAPPLPEEVIFKTRDKYLEAYHRLVSA